MKKIVYNACYGGFSLSLKAEIQYLKESGKGAFIYEEIDHHGTNYKLINHEDALERKDNWRLHLSTINYGATATSKELNSSYFTGRDIKRDDAILVKIVEELGKEANGLCANLKIAEVEGKWRIDEYDGYESVETPDSYDWND